MKNSNSRKSFGKKDTGKDTENNPTNGKVVPISGDLNLNSVPVFVESWKEIFTQRMLTASGSRKKDFGFKDAKKCTALIDKPFDKLLIEYLDFIASRPLQENDYFKYVDSYRKGKKLNEKYFRHDLEKLHKYYRKVDEDPDGYNPFALPQYEAYVLFMMVKLNGLYSKQFDGVFNVKIDGSREYNLITSLPSVLRQSLPFKIKEFDISQAYPIFIFLELGIKPFDVYKHIGKKEFNILLNTHKGVKGATIEAVRAKLIPIYGDRVNEVITEKRFNNKGQMFKDLSKYEADYIKKFVEKNQLTDFVRLHDGVVVLANVECGKLEFGDVIFKVKGFKKPELENEVITFYDPEYKTTPARYAKFFPQEGFIRLTEQGKDELGVIKNENKIIRSFNHSTDTLNFLSNEINEFNPEPLENIISMDMPKIKAGFMLMDGLPLKLHRDTNDSVFIPFKNGVAKITKDEVKIIPYSDKSIGFFAEVETLDHDFNYTAGLADQSVFNRFLINAVIGREAPENESDLTEKEIKSITEFCAMIGYLVSNYKNPSKNYAVILSDAGANDHTRNGGRGKSLIQEAIKRTRVSIDKAGDSFDTGYRHKYADLKKEHDVYIIDDAPAAFNYNSFYSEITGSISPERKGKEAELIPFKMTPKFVISTNYAIRYNEEDTSTHRRFIEYQFSDFWNANRKPNDYFDQNFFTDWNADEWNQFYCFITECVQIYLAQGVGQIQYNKDADNYRAYFYNDLMEQEFKRILNNLKTNEGFTVSDFLREYQSIQNPLRVEKFFHKNNVKTLVEVFLKENTEIGIRYIERGKEWVFDKTTDGVDF